MDPRREKGDPGNLNVSTIELGFDRFFPGPPILGPPLDPRLKTSSSNTQGQKRRSETESGSGRDLPSPKKISRQENNSFKVSANLPPLTNPPSLNPLRLNDWRLRIKQQGKEDKEHEYDPMELRLSPFFKCTKCEFRTHACEKFRSHLKECHGSEVTFRCFYCKGRTNRHKTDKHPSVNQLIDHLLIEHTFLRYQCNICPYRGCSADHVQLHHMSRHPDNYDIAMKELNPGYLTNITGKQPSRILYTLIPALGPRPDAHYYFKRFKESRKNSLSENSPQEEEFHCVYCPYKKPKKDKYHVFCHVVQDHPDFPILLYNDGDPKEASRVRQKELPAIHKDIHERRKSHAVSPAMPLTPIATPTDYCKASPLADPRLGRNRHDSSSSCVSYPSPKAAIEPEEPPQLPVAPLQSSPAQENRTQKPSFMFPSLPSVARVVSVSDIGAREKVSRKDSDACVEENEDDYLAEASSSKRNPKGYRAEKDNQLFEPVAVSGAKLLKCLIDKDGQVCNGTFIDSKKSCTFEERS